MKLINEKLEIIINSLGAEPQSIKNVIDGFDYLWNGDPKFWPRHAPILFPCIGNSNDGSYFLKGEKYTITQHGFARDFSFEKQYVSNEHICLQQRDNKKTYQMFPFHYLLQVDYHLIANRLITRYTVTNETDRDMPFSIGSHPAFNIPLKQEGQFEDYFIRTYPKVGQLRIFEAVLKPKPFRTGRVVPFRKDHNGTIQLSHDLFKNGLLIFENPGIDKIELYSPKTEHAVVLSIKEFPYFTLWTTENSFSPFLCIEPFAGLPDVLGYTVDWYQKEANYTLTKGEKVKFTYEMTFY
ncbi:aldose 1-epimerase family protein [Heyndrickxia acidiproducens]|uniref:aldose 1-epimerase family protein n=1 Tax=Heyndrickxia acidiproducens TaxID=1121084 RepID=UPI00036BE66B|nr:aldose 1-epimerase family protein [Heyndrickxia acidiproducens]